MQSQPAAAMVEHVMVIGRQRSQSQLLEGAQVGVVVPRIVV